jgi:hypothetical protein
MLGDFGCSIRAQVHPRTVPPRKRPFNAGKLFVARRRLGTLGSVVTSGREWTRRDHRRSNSCLRSFLKGSTDEHFGEVGAVGDAGVEVGLRLGLGHGVVGSVAGG